MVHLEYVRIFRKEEEGKSHTWMDLVHGPGTPKYFSKLEDLLQLIFVF